MKFTDLNSMETKVEAIETIVDDLKKVDEVLESALRFLNFPVQQ